LFAGRPINIEEMVARLKHVANDLGLPFGTREKTYNSRLAQEVGKWAESEGRGNEFHNAVFRAYFAEGLNISDISNLIKLGKKVGLPEDNLRGVLETRAYKADVDSDWARSYQLGITAVPTFMINHQAFVGAQPYNVLAKFMESNHVSRRNIDQ
jgi:predicted DsbA family dithiol-disulfide isomerase